MAGFVGSNDEVEKVWRETVRRKRENGRKKTS